jgi:LexA-binding, inner membrane-associated putative hydrolase
MDIVAHALWAGIGVAALRRRRPITPATAALTVAAAALPDVLQLLPIVGWWLFADGTWATLRAYVVAVPGQEPGLPQAVQLWSHHLHCVMHSAPVAALVTALIWAARRSIWLPLLGWWSHIVIDVFTHSADYYAVPVLYPFTERGFDGVAWNQPWMLALNYLALAATTWWVWRSGRSRAEGGALRP